MKKIERITINTLNYLAKQPVIDGIINKSLETLHLQNLKTDSLSRGMIFAVKHPLFRIGRRCVNQALLVQLNVSHNIT